MNPVNVVPKVEDVQSPTDNKLSVISREEISPIVDNSFEKLKKRITPVSVDSVSRFQALLNSHSDEEATNLLTKLKLTPVKNGLDLSPNTTTSTPIITTSSRLFDRKSTRSTGNAVLNSQLCCASGSLGLLEKELDSQLGENSNENVDILNYLSTNKNEIVRQKLDKVSKSDSKDSNSVDMSGEWRNLNNSNTPNSWSRIPTINESLNRTWEDSVSPIRINSLGTPQNSKWSQNSKSSPQHILNNTPKQGSQQRNPKTTPRQNASLGDFISIDTRGSRKNSAKKINAKIQSAKDSDGEGSIDGLSMTEESFPEIGKNSGRRRRRIKPTKLDVSDGKGTF